jgi:hypothetical protein
MKVHIKVTNHLTIYLGMPNSFLYVPGKEHNYTNKIISFYDLGNINNLDNFNNDKYCKTSVNSIC